MMASDSTGHMNYFVSKSYIDFRLLFRTRIQGNFKEIKPFGNMGFFTIFDGYFAFTKHLQIRFEDSSLCLPSLDAESAGGLSFV